MENKFNEEDKDQIIKFLNLVATKATFEMKTSDIIQYFKLLNFMQQTLLPKVDANIMEVRRIIESESEVSTEE